MGRDKRSYRFLLDNRFGRRVLAESREIPDIVKAVTDYVARRLVERERALEDDTDRATRGGERPQARIRRRRRNLGALLVGFVLGVITLAVVAFIFASLS
jgi:hypothetical protein